MPTAADAAPTPEGAIRIAARLVPTFAEIREITQFLADP